MMSESPAVKLPIQQLADSYNHFAMDLLLALLKANPNDNVVISPLSIAMALSMAHAAADGETQQGIAEALHLDGDVAAHLHASAAEIVGSLRDQASIFERLKQEAVERNESYVEYTLRNLDKEAKLAAIVELASSLWGASDVELSTAFQDICKQHYDATAETLDFADSQAAARINEWVAEATHGKITNILEAVDPSTLLILASTVYLKAKWAFKFFDPELTEEQLFTLPDGRQKLHPIMHNLHGHPYRADDQFQVIQLLLEGRRLRMWVALPNEKLPLSTLHEHLTPQTFERWSREFERVRGTIGLPRFKTSGTLSLSETLAHLGMQRAFHPEQAQFPAITSPRGRTFLSDVVHSALIEVNEEGIEGAAVTILLFTGGRDPQNPFEMIVNRPFFWLIDDAVTGAILFAGVTTDPQATPAPKIEDDEFMARFRRFNSGASD